MKKLLLLSIISVFALSSCSWLKPKPKPKFEDSVEYTFAKTGLDIWQSKSDSITDLIQMEGVGEYKKLSTNEMQEALALREYCEREMQRIKREMKEEEQLFYIKNK